MKDEILTLIYQPRPSSVVLTCTPWTLYRVGVCYDDT